MYVHSEKKKKQNKNTNIKLLKEKQKLIKKIVNKRKKK